MIKFKDFGTAESSQGTARSYIDSNMKSSRKDFMNTNDNTIKDFLSMFNNKFHTKNNSITSLHKLFSQAY